ncbi:MAG: hypothetical protein IPJ35_07355 [Elusimicrobia bacterium]|nr:hypothetical protein [Elusimicrobiota bacterium]
MRTVTFDYDGNNQLTKRNENKVWEDTKVSGGGGSAGGFLGIIIAVVIIVIAVVIAAAVVAVMSGAMTTFSSVMSTFLETLATSGFAAAMGTMGTVGLVAFVGAVFVLNFAVAYMMTGNLEFALIQGAIAAVSAYFMATGALSSAGGGATEPWLKTAFIKRCELFDSRDRG